MIDDRTSRERYVGGYRGTQILVLGRIGKISHGGIGRYRQYEQNVRDRYREVTTTSAQRDG